MTTIFFYSNKVTTAPVNSGDTWLAIEDLQTEVTLSDGRIVSNGALTIQGAKHTDEGISIAVDLDLVVAFGADYLMENGKHRHAGSAINLTQEDVSAQTWKRLVTYADACTSFEFNGRRLQLGNGAYFYSFLLGKPQAYVVFDIVESGSIEVEGVEYSQFKIDNFDMSENASVGISESADALTGTTMKRANPFAAMTTGSKPFIKVPAKLAK